MPPANHVVLASGAAVAVSVAIASAIALYESPELRRYADDLRRRIAIAMHSVGDSINPPAREPLFNRPEDAHGFLQSGGAAGVDADEETKRRQREELMYWNSVRLAKEAEDSEKKTDDVGEQRTRRGTFDDFMSPAAQGEKGSFVYKSGADVGNENETEGLRKRGMGAAFANPFADEHGISSEELEDSVEKPVVPTKDEAMSDIYSATDLPGPTTPTAEVAQPSLIDIDEELPKTPTTASSVTMDNERDDEYQTAGQDNQDEAYASIQAWAQNSSAPGFYSPLPSTPAMPVSEPELISDGQITPTDSMSLAGSGEDIADEARSVDERPFDVISESDGMLTPASWSEVGSVISESDAPVPAHAQ